MSALEINGKLVKDPDVILNEQEVFYKKLYTKDEKVSFNMVNSTNQKLDNTQKILLDSNISREEVLNSIKELARDKSPGPDGLTADWYKFFTNQIADVLLEAFLAAAKEGTLHNSALFGIISLIPK